MYNETILQRFQNPKNAGVLKGADGKGEVGNVQCGDIMNMYITVNRGGTITDAKFKTFGCVTAIVAADIACDLVRGKHIDDAVKITNKHVLDVMGEVPAQKVHCSVIAEEVIKKAVENYKKNLEKAKKK